MVSSSSGGLEPRLVRQLSRVAGHNAADVVAEITQLSGHRQGKPAGNAAAGLAPQTEQAARRQPAAFRLVENCFHLIKIARR